MDLRFFRPPGGFSFLHRRSFGALLLAIATILAACSTAALVTTCILGPTSLESISAPWALAFTSITAAEIAWWVVYLAVLDKLSAKGWRERSSRIVSPLVVLSTSVLPDLAVLLSGRLPYTLLFDEDGYREFRYLAGAIVMATVIVQEFMLLSAVQGVGPARLTMDGVRRISRAVKRLGSVPHVGIGGLPTYLPLLAILAIGAKLRLDSLNLYAYGDMDVMLSITYNILRWPPVTYYQNYVTQTWVYNHLPLFPIMLAPLYWLSEHVLHMSTAWAAKLLIGLADMAIAVLLYRQARGRWRPVWGLVLAAMWMLAPWVIAGDDHPIAMATLFAMLALATVERGWLSGFLLALGVATRLEAAFFVLPLMLHFWFHRGFRQSTVFLIAFGTTLGLIAMPFFLYGPSAMGYALMGQLQRDASTEMSLLTSFVALRLGEGIGTVLQHNPTVVALGLNLVISLLALRDHRVGRIEVMVSLMYILTLPILFDRYMLFSYGLTLLYAAQYANPLIAAAAFVMLWPATPFQALLPPLLLAAMAFFALAKPDRRKPAGHLAGAEG